MTCASGEGERARPLRARVVDVLNVPPSESEGACAMPGSHKSLRRNARLPPPDPAGRATARLPPPDPGGRATACSPPASAHPARRRAWGFAGGGRRGGAVSVVGGWVGGGGAGAVSVAAHQPSTRQQGRAGGGRVCVCVGEVFLVSGRSDILPGAGDHGRIIMFHKTVVIMRSSLTGNRGGAGVGVCAWTSS